MKRIHFNGRSDSEEFFDFINYFADKDDVDEIIIKHRGDRVEVTICIIGANNDKEEIINDEEEKDIADKAIDLYNVLAIYNRSGCELKLTKGYHMTVTISRSIEFPEFEPIKEESEGEENE